MDTMANIVKGALSMDQVARHYGFEQNRAGYIKCPFHADKTASLRVYKEPGRGWHCFGCGAGSTVIDFVMRLFNLSFSAALVRLNADFRLGLANGRPDPRELDKFRRERAAAENARAQFEAEYEAKTDTFRRLWQAKLNKAPSGPWEEFDPEYVEACLSLDRLGYWFDRNPFTAR